MIKNFKQSSIVGTLVGLALIVVLSGCTMTNGIKSTDENSSGKPADTTIPTNNLSSALNDSNSYDTQSDKLEKGYNDKNVSAKNTVSGQVNVSTSSSREHSQKGTDVPNSKQQRVLDTKGHEQQLKDIIALAKNGKVEGSDFVAGKTIIDDIHSTWGAPDRPWQPNDRYSYDTYFSATGQGKYAFGIGRGEVVYDIRYFGSPKDENQAFNNISFTEIKRTLGNPNSVKTNSGDDILIYKLGDYELKLVGPHKTQRLDHISIYSPKAAASMAS